MRPEFWEAIMPSPTIHFYSRPTYVARALSSVLGLGVGIQRLRVTAGQMTPVQRLYAGVGLAQDATNVVGLYGYLKQGGRYHDVRLTLTDVPFKDLVLGCATTGVSMVKNARIVFGDTGKRLTRVSRLDRKLALVTDLMQLAELATALYRRRAAWMPLLKWHVASAYRHTLGRTDNPSMDEIVEIELAMLDSDRRNGVRAKLMSNDPAERQAALSMLLSGDLRRLRTQ